MNPNRGSFPKINEPETPEAQRERYEQWLIATAVGTNPDPTLAAVLAQPNHDPSGKTVYLSNALSIRAKCWECVGGDEDFGAMDRIAGCTSVGCGLWPVRPYVEHETRSSRRTAINTHCRACQGGSRMPNVGRAVTECASSTCAIWLARPKLKEPEPDSSNLQAVYTA